MPGSETCRGRSLRASAVLAVLLVAVLVAGCGNGDDDRDRDDPTTTTEAPPDPDGGDPGRSTGSTPSTPSTGTSVPNPPSTGTPGTEVFPTVPPEEEDGFEARPIEPDPGPTTIPKDPDVCTPTPEVACLHDGD